MGRLGRQAGSGGRFVRDTSDPMKLHWFLPTGGDSRDLVPSGEHPHRRAPSLDYLATVARAAEQLGFAGMLTPTGTMCEDAWLTTAALLAETERIKFLVAFRPGLISPDAGRADGLDVPADVGWAPADERRDRGRHRGAGPLRRLARPRRALRPHRRVPRRAAGLVVGRAVRLRRRALPGPRGDHPVRARSGAGDLLRGRVAGGRTGGGGQGRRLPGVGRAAGDGGRAGRAGATAGCGRRAARFGSASGST